ncbi:MAG: hypothetical protein DIU74_005400 [Pseudomonadota bacterium]|nr:MAG: hypothetical protein DIU74_04155 [Pseudomonadota bacterium]
MAVDIPGNARRMYLSPISWQAIIAGLAVGIAVQLFLMLAGVAIGGLAIEPGEGMARMSAGAALWSAVSMLVAAFFGGYVAARASGLRRKGDGVLHGAVAWAASTLLYAVLASTVLSAATAGLFGQLRPMLSQAVPQSMQQRPQQADREQIAQTLRNLGLPEEQVQRIVDEAGAVAQGGGLSADTRATMESAADRLGATTGALAAAVALSLVAGIIGGIAGTRGQRRVRRHRVEPVEMSAGEARVVHRPVL